MAEAVNVKNDDTQDAGRIPAPAPRPAMQMPGVLRKPIDLWQRFRQFLHEVRVEVRQVTWPTRSDVQATTWVVIITVAFFGLYFLIVDTGASYLVQWIFGLFKR